VAVDVDLDGRLDVVASEYGGAGRLMVYHNDGGATSWTRQVLEPLSYTTSWWEITTTMVIRISLG
jgi:hypothetical protein